MRRLKIFHRTQYSFSTAVQLGPHHLMVRPREGHELHIESSFLDISPAASIRWHRDVDDNSVAIASFEEVASDLVITSEVICQHYDSEPLNFIVADDAVNYPFTYGNDESVVLAPYMVCVEPVGGGELGTWLASFWQSGETVQTYTLLERLCTGIHRNMAYRKREQPGVQSAAQTLSQAMGSCRDFANLFIEATRMLGIASRFVSGYLYNPPSDSDYGTTHAWAEVFLPGAGWKGFDPTIGTVAGNDHITVAVARRPDSIPPVSGTYLGNAESKLEVEVRVTDIPE